jgi:homospermidine synthase
MPKLVLFGCGGVGSALLELLHLFKNIRDNIKYESILIFDMKDLQEPILKDIKHTHIKLEITQENLTHVLEKYIFSKDIIVDVSYNIYFLPLIEWCLLRQVFYINTSIERWPVENEHILSSEKKELYQRSLLNFHQSVKSLQKNYPESTTIVLEHGMNPGLISHFCKMALMNVAEEVLKQNKLYYSEKKTLHQAYQEKDFAVLAQLMDLQTVHCSERDTQIPYRTRQKGEFMNTWGAYSLYGEGVDPVQIGYGTHEDINYFQIDNQVILPKRGAYTYAHSYVPEIGIIKGMVIPHGENDTLNRLLTIKKEEKVIYSPSNYYVYDPAGVAWQSMAEVKNNDYKMLPVQSALRGYHLKQGKDLVGVLLLFGSNPLGNKKEKKPVAYWSGTILSLEQTRGLGIKYAGPTTVQVAISLCSALKWMLAHPSKGICFPEDLSYQEILTESKGFLGTIYNDWVPYYPSDTKLHLFE